jgi:hypothetical protein
MVTVVNHTSLWHLIWRIDLLELCSNIYHKINYFTQKTFRCISFTVSWWKLTHFQFLLSSAIILDDLLYQGFLDMIYRSNQLYHSDQHSIKVMIYLMISAPSCYICYTRYKFWNVECHHTVGFVYFDMRQKDIFIVKY